MSVIAIFVVSSDSFPLGSCIENQPSAKIDIERIVPMREKTFPFIFVWDLTDFEQFERTTDGIPEIDLIQRLETFDNGRLYKIDWKDDGSPLVDEIVDNNGTILSAEGDATAWRFELRFPDHEDISNFFQDVTTEGNIDIQLKSLVQEIEYESAEIGPMLSDKQRRALETALHMGYYDVPRKAHLDDLAASLDISPSSTSALLRRGCQVFFEHHFD